MAGRRGTTLLPVLAGSLVAIGIGFGATVVLPTADAANTTTDSNTKEYTKGQLAGRHVYVSQGCVYCHTQQVRDSASDAQLSNRPSRPRDALGDRPAQFGNARFGPDLTCVGDRKVGLASGATTTEEDAVNAMIAYLQHPSRVHPGSTMPSFQSLAGGDLRHLAQYLVSQHCTLDASPGGTATP